MTTPTKTLPWVYDDGGRAETYKGTTRDCACRSIAIVTGLPYTTIYNIIIDTAKNERPRGNKKRSHPRTGVHTPTIRKVMDGMGWKFVPTIGIGTGCRVHLRADELPAGNLLVNVSGHITAVINGVIHDTYDCSRDGTRCVYGYWIKDDSRVEHVIYNGRPFL